MAWWSGLAIGVAGVVGGRERASNEFRELISLPPLLLPLSLQPTVPFAASEAGGTTLIF